MANKYVRSTDGNDADDGTTWALADATFTGAAATDVAGDVIWVSQVHAESTAAAITFNWDGNVTSPTRVLCGNDAAEPPTALATTATVTTTGNSDISTSSGADWLYVYGITFNSGSGAIGTANITLGGTSAIEEFDSCNFHLATTGTSSRINLSGANTSPTILRNCGFQFSASAQSILVTGKAQIQGGSILADVGITTLFQAPVSGARILVEGCDLSNGATAMDLAASTNANVHMIVRNCKLPTSWSGSTNTSTTGAGSIFELYNSDSADTNYRFQRKTRFGQIDGETTIVRTGGASDGTTAISWPAIDHPVVRASGVSTWTSRTG